MIEALRRKLRLPVTIDRPVVRGAALVPVEQARERVFFGDL
ncbi:hypothetical protein [Nonomuraea terrae]|nr:hypothetical protein [Nonomuraea terrae]